MIHEFHKVHALPGEQIFDLLYHIENPGGKRLIMVVFTPTGMQLFYFIRQWRIFRHGDPPGEEKYQADLYVVSDLLLALGQLDLLARLLSDSGLNMKVVVDPEGELWRLVRNGNDIPITMKILRLIRFLVVMLLILQPELFATMTV